MICSFGIITVIIVIIITVIIIIIIVLLSLLHEVMECKYLYQFDL